MPSDEFRPDGQGGGGGGRSTWMGSRWGLRGFMERERAIGVRRGDGPGFEAGT